MARPNERSRLLRYVLCGAFAVLPAFSPLAAEPKPVDSWGRANADYETYRNDSLECGLLGYSADVSQTEQAQAFLTASRRLESIDDTDYAPPDATSAQTAYMMMSQASQYQQIRHGVRAEKRMKELHRAMVEVVERCLIERGYVRFRLTDGQREALAELAPGSDRRREFLYSLASDPAVLEAQAR